MAGRCVAHGSFDKEFVRETSRIVHILKTYISIIKLDLRRYRGSFGK